MTDQFVGAKKITLETHCKDADASAKPIVIAAHHNNVLNSSVWPLVAKELVEKMPIALPETTELNAHVLPISWVKPDPDVTLNVPDMTIAKTTRHA